MLTNPDILRHLQSLQQQIAQPVVQANVAHSNHHHEEPNWELANNHGHGQYGQVDFTQPPPGFIPMGAAAVGHPPMGFPPHHSHPAAQFQQHQQQQQHQQHQPPTVREDLFQPGNGEVIEIDPPRSK